MTFLVVLCLEELRDSKLDLDLREVQESILENTAMYAKNPEVLGSMIHLVFGLDVMSQWVTARDSELDLRLGDLDALQQEQLKHRRALEEMTTELQELRATGAMGAISAPSRETGELQRLRRENERLQRELRERAGSSVASPAVPAGAEWAHVKPLMLQCLEQLEPMLATMPATPAFLDLQEEACEAYYELRRILLEAMALNPPRVQVL